MNQEAILQSIDDMINTWSSQKELHVEIKKYKEKENVKISDETKKFDLEFHDHYIQFLNEATKSILELQEKEVIDEKENDKKRTKTRRAK